MAERGLLRQLKNRQITAHALTHVHPDHQGASKTLSETFRLPVWCSETEVAAMESGDMHGQIPRNAVTRLQDVFWTGPGVPVTRGLREGDCVGGFVVIDSPGHSPGHLAYWREKDRVLILGDVARNIDFFTLREGLGEPPSLFTTDRAENWRSAQKLAALKPRLVCFGHGKPVEGAKFVEFVQSHKPTY
jgi:glyoxylase-like metal-dependent hydrolase (beta-lactamase superfamily II)